MLRLNQLREPVTEQLVAVVHLVQPLLVFRKLDIQLVHGLRSTGPNCKQRGRIIERSDRDGVLLPFNLSSEESNATSHVVHAANFGNKRTLELVYLRVQLYSGLDTIAAEEMETSYVFELDIS